MLPARALTAACGIASRVRWMATVATVTPSVPCAVTYIPFSAAQRTAAAASLPMPSPAVTFAPCRPLSRGYAAESVQEVVEFQAPFLSDQVPLPDGMLGQVEEIPCKVGQILSEGDPLVILETHKASLFIKVQDYSKVKVTEILVELGQEIKELQVRWLRRPVNWSRACFQTRASAFMCIGA